VQHKQVRYLTRYDSRDAATEELKREDHMVRWADSFYLNSMRMAAAASLAECGTLEKAASLLENVGFKVPAGFFPEEEEDEFWSLDEEEALRRYVERDEEGIRAAHASIGCYLAKTGRSMDPVEDYLKQ
jgi:hypothetical protein